MGGRANGETLTKVVESNSDGEEQAHARGRRPVVFFGYFGELRAASLAPAVVADQSQDPEGESTYD